MIASSFVHMTILYFGANKIDGTGYVLNSYRDAKTFFTLLLQPQSQSLRRLSSSARNDGTDLSKPCEFLGSWSPPSDPRVAQANLERLRRAYGKHSSKEMRTAYTWHSGSGGGLGSGGAGEMGNSTRQLKAMFRKN